MPGSPPTRIAEAGDEAAAEHAVELGDAGLGAGRRRLGRWRGRSRARRAPRAAERRPGARGAARLLDDGVPGAAGVAAPGPLEWRAPQAVQVKRSSFAMTPM